MKDIAGEAILFDMYYMAKDPVPLAGEKREMPKIETLPVTEATPVFRDFYISNIVCNGAGKAIFLRGIPEMNVRNVNLENMVLKTHKGIESVEASDILFKNFRLITDDSAPLIYLQNTRDTKFEKIMFDHDASLLFSVNGTGVLVLR